MQHRIPVGEIGEGAILDFAGLSTMMLVRLVGLRRSLVRVIAPRTLRGLSRGQMLR
jgi:hypothetical protein